MSKHLFGIGSVVKFGDETYTCTRFCKANGKWEAALSCGNKEFFYSLEFIEAALISG
jgi:hypothetical protein